jgi:hypothetical protein
LTSKLINKSGPFTGTRYKILILLLTIVEFTKIVKLRIELYKQLEEENIVHSSLFSRNGMDKISQLGAHNKLLMLHRSIKASISDKESQFMDDDNIYTIFELGPYVEDRIEALLKKNEIDFDLEGAEIPEIEISERFLNSDKNMVRLGSIPEPTRDTDSEALGERVEDLCEVILAGIERDEFMEGYYDRQ